MPKGGGALGEVPLPPPGPRKKWENVGNDGERKGKVREGGAKKTKQINRTRKCLQVFKVSIKCCLVQYCSRIFSDLIT